MVKIPNFSSAAAKLFPADEASSSRYQVADVALELLATEMADNLLATVNVAVEEERETVFTKLEQLGYSVGTALIERMTRDRPRFADNLEIVKYICKDFWSVTFQKTIDNLKTNHRGQYVFQDNNFKMFARMSTEAGSVDASRKAVPYLLFPCGLIRGALTNLGLPCVVAAETTSLPQCTFHIKLNAKS